VNQFTAYCCLLFVSLLGCSHYDDYQNAMELKAQAERTAEDAREIAAAAEARAAEAQAQLSTEQRAMTRIYTED